MKACEALCSPPSVPTKLTLRHYGQAGRLRRLALKTICANIGTNSVCSSMHVCRKSYLKVPAKQHYIRFIYQSDIILTSICLYQLDNWIYQSHSTLTAICVWYHIHINRFDITLQKHEQYLHMLAAKMVKHKIIRTNHKTI